MRDRRRVLMKKEINRDRQDKEKELILLLSCPSLSESGL
jgi:hypothetical protein